MHSTRRTTLARGYAVLVAFIAIGISLVSPGALAADVIKANNTDTFNLGTSWVGGTLPTSIDVAVFDSTYATTGVLGTGGLVVWQGIRVANPGGDVIVDNGTAGNEVALGLAGTEMLAATANLNIQRLRVDASQDWTIASNRTFNLGNSAAARTGVLSLSSGGPFTITKKGLGTVQLDTSNTAIGAVNWDIQSGLIRAIWNGSSAWGTGTIALSGGGIATGTSFAGSVGNWTWNNSISLTSATSSFIDNQNTAGNDRWLNLLGVISGAGSIELRDTGAGFNNPNFGLILSATNTNTGTVTIASGAEVRVGSSNVSGSANTGNNGKLAADSAAVVNNGTLSFSRLDAHTVANNISGTGSVRVGLNATIGTATTTQTVIFTGANNYSGGTTINNGTLQIGSGGTTGTLGSGNVVNSGVLSFNRSDSVTVANTISGAGSLTHNSTGTTTLSGGNTYTGGTTLSQGTLIATNVNALGTGGTITMNAAGSSNIAVLLGSVTMGRPISVANQGSGTVTLGSTAAVAAPTFSGVITLAKDITLDGSTNTGRLTFTGGIGGTGNVTIAGTGRVVFTTAANTYAGSTTVGTNSILQLSDGGATATQFIPDTSVVSMGVGSFLKLAKGSNNETIGGLTGTGTVRGHEAVTNAASILTINNTVNHIFSGLLENGGAAGSTLALIKNGLGTQTLTGTNTYSGATTVPAGTLLVNGSLGSGSAVTVQAAGTLGGVGTIGGATTIFGTHRPGTSPGVQTFGGNLAYDGATVVWELIGNTATQAEPVVFDQVIVGSNLEFTSATSLSLVFDDPTSVVNWNDSFWGSDREWLLYDVAGATTNFASFSVTTASWVDGFGNVFATARPDASFSLRQAAGTGDVLITYVAVPEPGFLALAGCGLGLLAWRLTRRRDAPR